MTTHDVPRNSFSLTSIFYVRGKAFDSIRRHTAAVDAIASELEALDASMQMCITERSVDEQQDLITSARRLASLLDCEVAE